MSAMFNQLNGKRFVTVRRAALSLLVACAVLPAISGSASGEEFGLVPGSFTADTFKIDPATNTPAGLETQAGAHPDAATTRFQIRFADERRNRISGYIRDIDVKLPRGFIGNPEAATKCSRSDFDALVADNGQCPASSQVGIANILEQFAGFIIPLRIRFPVYNLEPMPGQTADFGIPVLPVPVHLSATVDTAGDYQLQANVTKMSQGVPVLATDLTLWGVPGDPSHANELACGRATIGGCTAQIERRPFLTNPTECNGPTTSTVALDSWENPGVWSTAAYTPREQIQGCDRLDFRPSIRVSSGSPRASSPAGYTVDIDIPQNDDPDGLGTPPLRDVTLTLPEGAWITAGASDGLQGCTDAQMAFRSNAEPTCPDASKIGSVTVRTPLLPKPMEGEVYLGQPLPGNLFRMFLTLRGPGLLIKLPGTIKPDPNTGRVTTIFKDNPPLAFSNLHLVLKGGPRAPLSNPSACGPATTTATLTGWGSGPVQVSSSFDITQKSDGTPCGSKGFNPSFSSGMSNAAAGTSGTFSLTFGRGDDDQFLNDVTVQMPQGVTGVLASVTPCPEAQAAAGACGEESRIGSVTSGAGAGSAPLYLPGRVYLTGPYKGAPLGLSIVVPAIAGPFDLGTVSVRSALFADKNTTELRVVSDPFPRILEGVPLQIRTIDVKIDKPGFMLSPTNCHAKRLDGRITSTEGAAVDRSTRFQVGSCRALPFKPKMAIRIGKKGRTRPGITVPFKTVVRMSDGQANLRSVRVNLPDNINARLPVINNNSCSLEEYQSGRCPESRAVGSATAITPLLKDPLRGKAFFVRNPARRIPDLVVALKGQVDVDVTGKVSIPRDLTLATTFDTIPDVPITKFTLNLVAGRSGPIGTIGNLCSKRVRRGMKAKLVFKGQNGRATARRQKISIAGCGKAKKTNAKKGKKHHARRGASKKTTKKK